MCDEKRVLCVLQFSEDHDWVKVINGYESSIEVFSEDQLPSSMTRDSSTVLLDVCSVC